MFYNLILIFIRTSCVKETIIETEKRTIMHEEKGQMYILINVFSIQNLKKKLISLAQTEKAS